ncbi:MAG TPA: 2OG-Fe(II) oxygenase [Acidimicrobiales bacterium]|nr:2OG-Fe(II) oxygenase [Acidimicrobiales bacterium]
MTDLLENRRWWVRTDPFRHVIARSVFKENVYRSLEQEYRETLAANGKTYLDGHDLYGETLTADMTGALSVFLSREWHDLLAGFFDVNANCHVACGLHHHDVGSKDGFPHNDMNPGWFARTPDSVLDGVTLPRPDLVRYTDGRVLKPGVRAEETTRAIAAIFYINNQPWRPGYGGSTGLYRSVKDPSKRPATSVPPINNSLLAFECTPFSFHGFIENNRQPRDSIVMWLHQPKDDVIRRWGEHAIIQYS